MNATEIPNTIQVVASGRLFDNELFFTVSCENYDEYKRLPAGMMFEGRAYGLTGWNSDVCLAYYKNSKTYATRA